jgi:hypothetical protein
MTVIVTANPDGVPLYLVELARWVLWREEPRINRKTGETETTKPPIAYHTGKPCDVTNPRNWTYFASVVAAMERSAGAFDGCGFVLGDAGQGEWIIGADLDECLNADEGIAPWAMDPLAILHTYTDKSPGGHGLKPIARLHAADVPEARRLLDLAEHEFARSKILGEKTDDHHAPGVVLYLGKRFFTVTGRSWHGTPEDVALLSLDQIARLAHWFGPKKPAASQPGPPADDDETKPDEALVRDKLGHAFIANPRLRERWEGGTGGLNDTSRSGCDMSIVGLLITAGFSYGETRAALRLFRFGKLAEEEALGTDDRYFDRMWERSGASPRIDPGPEPDPTPDAVRFIQQAITPITQIVPRQWAYGRFLLFGSAAVIGAMDGTGKGYIAVAIMLAFITGEGILGENVWRKGPIAIVTYEDSIEEWQRRFAAACLQHSLDYETVMQSVRFITKPGGRVVFAQAGREGVLFPDSDSIAHQLKAGGFVLMLIDPFNNAHALDDGNNNVAIAAVAAEMSRIARTANVVVLVLHHLRKGAHGDPDDLMGALMLRANFRSCRILQKMTTDEAGKLGLSAKEAWRYIRISGTKENYSIPADRATWFKLETVWLGNGAGLYPDGDAMGAAITWEPPTLFEGMNALELHTVFAAIDAKPHARAKQATTIPWIGRPLLDVGNRTEDQATKIVAAWVKSGVLVTGEPHHATNRTAIQTLVTNPTKVAEILNCYPLGP